MVKLFLVAMLATVQLIGNTKNESLGELLDGNYHKVKELLEKACDGGEVQGCTILEDINAKGEIVKQDYNALKKLFRKTCDDGDALGCYVLGSMYDFGRGVKQDYSTAAKYYRKACNNGYLGGCFNIGAMRDRGQGVKQDYALALKYYRKACYNGDAPGCNNLGSMYTYGKGVKQDHVVALKYYRKACDGDYGLGCFNAGAAYEQGKGVKQDYSTAVKYYGKGCDNENPAGCNNLGSMYEFGRGVKKDDSKAKELYKKACDSRSVLGDVLATIIGCKNYARLTESTMSNLANTNEKVCSMIQNNYLQAVSPNGIPLDSTPADRFMDKKYFEKNKLTYMSFENPDWLKDVKWMQWKVLSYSGDFSESMDFKLLAITEKLPDNTKFLLSIGFVGTGWGGSNIYSIYSVDGDTPTEALTDMEALSKIASTRRVFPNEYYDGRTPFSSFHLRNIFEFKGSYYLLGGGESEYNKFNVIKIDHGDIIKDCFFTNYRSDKHDEFLRLFDSMIDKITGCGYDKTCKGTIGDMNCWHSGYLTKFIKHKQNSKTNFEKSKDFVHYNDLLNYKIFRFFSNKDIWSKRFVNTFIAVLPLAKKDLISLLIDDGFSEQKASEASEIIISDALSNALDGSRFYYLEHDNKNGDDFFGEVYSDIGNYLVVSDKIYNSGAFPSAKKSKDDALPTYISTNHDADFYSLALSYIPKLDDDQLKSIIKPNEFGKNLLMYAVQMNDYKSTKRLIKFYQKSASIKDEEYCTNITLQGRTVMHYAAENASLELIALLIQEGFSIRDKDVKGNDLSFYLQKNMLISDENKKLGMKFFEQLKNKKKDMVISPSFDCKKASNAKERAICGNETLANYDASLSLLYSRLKTNPRFSEIKQSQREWLKSLNRICKTSTFSDSSMICLINQYRDRNYFLYKYNEYIEKKQK